ncbi:hypothetical protein GWI33_005003 [Rhynchophorus ferrugineus]|uniref:Uncharacterized protein n=1 Tax=Rhynchophorus ferrugineus TaxID=354439 RepID=A0A834IL93_RHYFE|nr:hypothetical protein GWI33_005003 [Rhynchophorus ferrugineus]
MRQQLVLLFLIVSINWSLSLAREGLPLLSPGGIGGIFLGPGSETIIRGPDGSEIVTEEKPGSITREDSLEKQPIVVAEPQDLSPVSIKNAIANEVLVSSTNAPIISSSTTAPAVKLFTPEVAPQLSPIQSTLLTGEIYNEEIPPPQISPTLFSASPSFVPLNIAPLPLIPPDVPIIGQPGGGLSAVPAGIVSNEAVSILSGTDSATITVTNQHVAAGASVQGTTVISSTLAPPVLSFEASSTNAPSVLSSTTLTPNEYATPVPVIPAVAERKSFIPIVEYNSIRGVINDPGVIVGPLFSSTEAPIISSTAPPIAGNTRPAVPANYLVAPDPPISTTSGLSPSASEVIPTTTSASIQKIPRPEDSISVDDRIDMGVKELKRKNYKIPQVLNMALAQFYRKIKYKDKDNVVINDKLGELNQNEITGNKPLFAPPALAATEYIGPALERNGIDISKVNLEHVPLSEVIRLSDETYGYNVDQPFFPGRYQRNVNDKQR